MRALSCREWNWFLNCCSLVSTDSPHSLISPLPFLSGERIFPLYLIQLCLVFSHYEHFHFRATRQLGSGGREKFGEKNSVSIRVCTHIDVFVDQQHVELEFYNCVRAVIIAYIDILCTVLYTYTYSISHTYTYF